MAEPRDYEEFEGDENAIDLRAFHTLGGVLHFNLLHMPPQPKTIKQWTMTRRKHLHTCTQFLLTVQLNMYVPVLRILLLLYI